MYICIYVQWKKKKIDPLLILYVWTKNYQSIILMIGLFEQWETE